MAKHAKPSTEPTQVAHPWKATLRAVIIFGLSILPALPDLADAANIDEVPTVASVLIIAAAIQRIITLPTIDRLLARVGLGAKDRREYLNEED